MCVPAACRAEAIATALPFPVATVGETPPSTCPEASPCLQVARLGAIVGPGAVAEAVATTGAARRAPAVGADAGTMEDVAFPRSGAVDPVALLALVVPSAVEGAGSFPASRVVIPPFARRVGPPPVVGVAASRDAVGPEVALHVDAVVEVQAGLGATVAGLVVHVAVEVGAEATETPPRGPVLGATVAGVVAPAAARSSGTAQASGGVAVPGVPSCPVVPHDAR